MNPNSLQGHRILIAEDEPEVRNYLSLALQCDGYSVDSVEDGDQVLSYLEKYRSQPSLLIMDIMMPHRDGIATLRELRRRSSTVPVLMLSGAATPSNIVECMKFGAVDFLAKPVEHEELTRSIERAIKAKGLPQDVPDIATSSWRERTERLIPRIANSDVPVLLRGETGVGKEVIARRIHELSRRSSGPFLKLNCAALPPELVESELFGYERGAFTGALRSSPGRFEMANGGTILLDEIGDMDFKLQAKLLQVLQDREFLRLGGREVCRVDVRVMAATHCDLEAAIADGRFREDLYYRLNIVELRIPPLRERAGEVLSLAKTFMQKYTNDGAASEIPPALKRALQAYDWPGNVRQLENIIRKFLVLGDEDSIITELTPKDNRKIIVLPAANPATATSALQQVNVDRCNAERDAIVKALSSTHWNRKEAAVLLRVDYKALLYKMKKLGIAGKRSEPGMPELAPRRDYERSLERTAR
ncbi:MAG TPA: sigma-54 dependent transcriptional regulator [Bryobacteraceae bacterium]|nr:sigma-54 dependent transcriptional regulator [Bryobacteraceae bacterium]